MTWPRFEPDTSRIRLQRYRFPVPLNRKRKAKEKQESRRDSKPGRHAYKAVLTTTAWRSAEHVSGITAQNKRSVSTNGVAQIHGHADCWSASSRADNYRCVWLLWDDVRHCKCNRNKRTLSIHTQRRSVPLCSGGTKYLHGIRYSLTPSMLRTTYFAHKHYSLWFAFIWCLRRALKERSCHL
jgi:hypothetical protein